MDIDNILKKEQINIEYERKNNYLLNYANLVADNIASYYKIYGNDNKVSLHNIKIMSNSMYILDEEETSELNSLINKKLNEKHKLVIVSNYDDEKIILGELE